MLSHLKFRFTVIASRSRVHRTTIIRNPNGIHLGRNCRIDAFSIIKGGCNPQAGLIISDYVLIKKGAYLSACNALIEIGNYAFIGVNSWVGGEGNIKIGNNSMISINCVVISSNHDYLNITRPYYNGPEIAKDIVIGENVWIGSNCVILPGVNIGDGVVVGAGSTVTKDIPNKCMAYGAPAKVIRSLGEYT